MTNFVTSIRKYFYESKMFKNLTIETNCIKALFTF